MEWEALNRVGLRSVISDARSVELNYTPNDEMTQFLPELERLVKAEQGCCGAAGVEFTHIPVEDGTRVVVKVVREGLPSQTVIAAFAAMTPSQELR